MAATPPPLPKRSRIPWPVRGLIAVGALFPLAVILAYPIENWRGKRAWEKCKREMAAKGEVLDWNALIPPSVPDAQNFFKAPKMAEWFVRGGANEFASRLNPENLNQFSRSQHPNVLANTTIVSSADRVESAGADIVLRYDRLVLTLDDGAPPGPESEVIPLIQFQDVPLLTGIENLARQGHLSYRFDSKVGFSERNQPYVSLRWEKLSAQQALLTLLDNYNLQWIDDPNSSSGIITTSKPGQSGVYVTPKARLQIGELVGDRIGTLTNKIEGPSASASQGFTLLLERSKPVKPLRVIVRAEKQPSEKDILGFFPSEGLGVVKRASVLHVQSVDEGFRVLINPQSHAAPEYLAWSDQFTNDFNLIREALKRPYARMDGDYRQPHLIPMQNYMLIRNLAQTLAQRAQCYLLLGEPENALGEVTLIRDLSRMLEGKPTGKPMTLVAAMINTAITGLYTEVVADGLRLHAWREPQLAALQEQLKQVNLPPLLAEGFRSERASFPQTVEIMFASWETNSASAENDLRPILPNFKKVRRGFPHGWLYQNYVRTARLYQEMIGFVDLTNNVVLARETDAFNERMQRIGAAGFRPYTFMTLIAMPNYTRAILTVTLNQTQADEALVACALERYHLANGRYPETLNELSPQFLEKLPHDLITGKPLKYRRMESGEFALYSTGWNATDEGGVKECDRTSFQAMAEGDWVWR